MIHLLYLFFFGSGVSGLVYQVVWVRVFGNMFGNTVYSASLVIAVFMLGLGAGSYVVGVWADRRYVTRPDSLLRAYGYCELVIGVLGLGISALLPHLGQLSALVSAYSRGADGWYALSAASYFARGAIAIVLLTPITLLMGGTLTLLIRHRVRQDLAIGGWRIAVLYAVNTAGAALGCFLTDFALVPAFGLRATQIIAVSLNLFAGLGALWLAQRVPSAVSSRPRDRKAAIPAATAADAGSRPLVLTSLALALTGFAAMGMEILWFRHFSIMLGEFRAVFSLLLTVILIGIGAGAFAGGFLHRRTTRPAQWLMAVQGLFVVSALVGLATASEGRIKAAAMADAAYQAALAGRPVAPGWGRTFAELWFNASPILLELGLPALLMGFAFPLGNAVIQNAERSVGRRAGVLYLFNTVGAVCGSLAAGFLLLPTLGMQSSATVLMIAAGLAVVPLYLASPSGRDARVFAGSLLAAALAIGWWLILPSDHVIARAAQLSGNERVLTVSEGINELIAIVEGPGQGRTLMTNGHPMSSTETLSQRYMRALAHVPLLSMNDPRTVLVMCFGVGNTAHAATLHPSIARVEVVDLSRHILDHAGYFGDTNGDVLDDPRVAVYVNDGRQHLQMQPEASYDLITLEPPPIAQAGMGALYSKEFYALARARLKPGGYMSQWLPVVQVPEATTMGMVRAFVDVFPQTVLLSGARTHLLLIGTNDSRIEIDPERVAAALARAPAVQADLQRLDLGSVREIVGTFVASSQTLANATRDSAPATDDRPLQEYGVRSLLALGETPPMSIVDVSQVAAWCPACFADGRPVPRVDGLEIYLGLLNLVYQRSSIEVPGARTPKESGRVIAGSGYLGAIVPDSAEVHSLLGAALAAKGRLEDAIAEFREAVQLSPDHGETRYRLATILLESGKYEEAADEFRAALRLMPNSAEAYNNFGVALASQGRLDEAIDQFQRALALAPGFPDARRNLSDALQQRQDRAKRGGR